MFFHANSAGRPFISYDPFCHGIEFFRCSVRRSDDVSPPSLDWTHWYHNQRRPPDSLSEPLFRKLSFDF
uniref:Uncharacterized protein n=1 Tax=Utricularia reniformis TaxID=192314 RepID=A0A1Y0AZ72_9LAMI|nr:hypothetical protein AEK19_MT0203 [Utricularia reniformis]ART30482.1 hypothetical protein AEK19_MT0203 [Utricularia reniformis]